MEPHPYIEALEANAAAIAALARAMPVAQVRWRPAPTAWSTLEVLNHLADEEREDFRTRLDYALHRPGETPPPIDPVGWVVTRAYHQRELDESLARFLAERQHSLTWLHGLAAPDWARACRLPSGHSLHAGDLLVAWVAHDLLHLRQLVELQYQAHASHAAPYSGAYAGPW